MFLDITIKKDFIMITVLSVEDFNNIAMGGSKGGMSKYPWYTLDVGQGFSVPLSDLRKTDYRPNCPPSLAKTGVKFISRKAAVDGVKSIVLQRVA